MQTTLVHVIPNMSSQSGGTSRLVSDLTDHLASSGNFKVELVTHFSPPGREVLTGSKLVTRHNVTRVANIKRISEFREKILSVVSEKKKSIIHSHGIWHSSNFVASKIAKDFNFPIAIQPHGMLQQWALRHKAFKKAIALLIYQRRQIDQATVLIGTSLSERDAFRKFGYQGPVAVIPNGISIRSVSEKPLSSCKEERQRVLLFLSRIHPVKGIENLLRAWSALRPVGWRLVVAGTGDSGYLKKLNDLIVSCGIQNSVELVGEVSGYEKARLFSQASVFVLPSYSENFGLAVAEALSYSLPVVTTRGTPWEAIQQNKCGWWVEPDEKSITLALAEALSLSDKTIEDMGRRAEILATQFSWPNVVGMTSELYLWMSGDADKPSFVY